MNRSCVHTSSSPGQEPKGHLRCFCLNHRPIISFQILGDVLEIGLSYQADGEQPGGREPVRHKDEGQTSDCDRGPEYAVQAAGSLVAHQQGRGHGVGVDEASVGALGGRLTTAGQGPSSQLNSNTDMTVNASP